MAQPSFSAWMKAQRASLDLSLAQVSAKVKERGVSVSAGYLSQIEKGRKTNPSKEIVSAVIRALGDSPEGWRAAGLLPPAPSIEQGAPVEVLTVTGCPPVTIIGWSLSNEEREILRLLLRRNAELQTAHREIERLKEEKKST